MPQEDIPPSPIELKGKEEENENDEWRKILLALFFLLLSFSCIFLSSQTALWLIDRDSVEASMRALTGADYASGSKIALAPLDEKIKAEAARDEALLTGQETPSSQGFPVAVLPNPLPTVTLQPYVPPTFTPTPTPDDSDDSGAVAPTVAGLPSPTVPLPAPTATAMPTTGPLPTATAAQPSPTTAPTVPPPTAPPPTDSPPPTSPPPTSPPPTLPPPTATQTPVPPTATPTATPTPTFTPTPTATPLSEVRFSASSYNVSEGAGSAVITTTLSAASGEIVTVDYASSNGTAADTEDYAAVNDTLTFNPGQTTLTFTVPITDDILANEGNEGLQLTLANASPNLLVGSPNPATLTIADNDPQPTVFFDSPNYLVIEDAGPAVIGVNLSAASALPVTVTYSSADVTAVAPDDYTAVNDLLTFSPGQTSLTFTVASAVDTLDEPNEEVELTLSSPDNAALGSPVAATLVISDDDGPGSCADSEYPPGEPDIGTTDDLADGDYVKLGCGVGMVIDLGVNPVQVNDPGDPDYDLILYELYYVPPLTPPDMILMDVITVSLGTSPSGPWYPVFAWGDKVTDTNTNLWGNTPPVPNYSDPGPITGDNMVFESPPLVAGTTPFTSGIQIDVDMQKQLPASGPFPVPPSGNYRYIQIATLPTGGGNGDGPEVDAIQIINP